MSETLQLLAFLYASMPLPDSVDYSRDYWVQNIETTLQARQEMTWGETIPEREFRHFVLPVRVNNEDLDESRIVFYDELKDRVKGLSVSDAILEVNHWCHEKVTYTPSDERTSSPLNTVKTAIGRCGEESTFLVAALRSVCIPARQVYTPRWAHTDDNHAWVEAWADGEWHFLGACEPEAVLDLGWFNAPASRGMLMHTKAFGKYEGPEEVMQRTKCYTEIDVTSNYAPVAKSYVQVIDPQGKPVQDAQVSFKIYNYAEFYTVSTKQTDANGVTYMQAGLGDLVAWASKDGSYGFERFTIGKSDTLQVMLSHKSGETYSLDMEIVPPKERNNLPFVSEEAKTENARRLAYEDSLRNAYVASFATEGLLKLSRGNHPVIQSFLDEADDPAKALGLLNNISEKDLHDIPLDVLMDSYRLTPPNDGLDVSLYYKYVLSPRVANEKLTPFRNFFIQEIPVEDQRNFRQNPDALVRWISEQISIDTERNPQNLRMTPIGAYCNRKCDAVSRNILFVAMARTAGLPARIDPVTGKTQYLNALEKWVDVTFGTDNAEQAQSPKGSLQLSFAPERYLKDPKYFSHFTLSQIVDGHAQLLNYAEEDTWESLFGNGKTQILDSGDYMLISGTRMADGSVLVHVEVAPAEAGKTTSLPLVMRHSDEGLQVIGSLNAEHLYKDTESGEKSLLSTTGRGFYVLGIIAPNNEPTNHTLRDIAQYREQLDEWGGSLMLLFRNEDEAARFRKDEFPALPKNTHFGIDHSGAILDEITSSLHLASQTLPLFVIADTFNRIVFLSEGYTIGLGEQLVKGLSK